MDDTKLQIASDEDYALAGAPDPFLIIKYNGGAEIWFGSQVVVGYTTVGTAAGRNIALGGGSSSGNWGQAGGGASSSITRVVTTITAIPCVYATHSPQVVPTVIYREAPVVHHARRHHPRKHVVHCPSAAVLKMCEAKL